MQTPWRHLVPITALWLSACAGNTAGPTGEAEDAGATFDAREVTDAGIPDDDAGDLDASSTDGGARADAGAADTDAGAPDGGGSTQMGRLPLGRATTQSSNDCNWSAQVPLSRCLRMRIACPNVSDIGVRLKVTEPTGPVRGTIVFGVGGAGAAPYETFGAEAINRILLPLHAMGYRLVQWAFDQPGWLVGPGGPMAEACRPATMFDAVYREIHHAGDGAYCATGNSGGSAAISYALAHYGLGERFDFALPTSGPPLGRVDHGCLGANDAAWTAECDQLRFCSYRTCVYVDLSLTFLDTAYANRACSTHDRSMAGRFLDDSVMNPLADVNYPNTVVRFLFGSMDCSESVPLGRTYEVAITSQKSHAVVQGAGHDLPASAAGADQIFQDLLDGCVAHH